MIKIMKAINDEYRLKKKILEYEEKLKDPLH